MNRIVFFEKLREKLGERRAWLANNEDVVFALGRALESFEKAKRQGQSDLVAINAAREEFNRQAFVLPDQWRATIDETLPEILEQILFGGFLERMEEKLPPENLGALAIRAVLDALYCAFLEFQRAESEKGVAESTAAGSALRVLNHNLEAPLQGNNKLRVLLCKTLLKVLNPES